MNENMGRMLKKRNYLEMKQNDGWIVSHFLILNKQKKVFFFLLNKLL